jgi:hypothetical protein
VAVVEGGEEEVEEGKEDEERRGATRKRRRMGAFYTLRTGAICAVIGCG